MRIHLLLLIAASLIAANRCLACLWDSDTLEIERQRFPDAMELIAGLFPRHSSDYYYWRIDDRTARAEEHRTPADYDDIAVAYDKLGQHSKAIEIISAKIDRWPDEFRYESEANLGTFLIHAGRLEEGLPHIDKAIEINPEAHFGREIYQKLLVKYVLRQMSITEQLPLNRPDAPFEGGFGEFVLYQRTPNDRFSEIQDAVTGVLGMMRFGDHASPILLEALGDLLSMEHEADDAKQLAARAYLKASYATDDRQASIAYRKMAEAAIEMHEGVSVFSIEESLKVEMNKANLLFKEISADERAWAAAGKDLDREFAAKYLNSAASRSEFSIPPLHLPTVLLLLLPLLGIALMVLIHLRRKKNFFAA